MSADNPRFQLKHQILHEDLANPVAIAYFNNDGICADFAYRSAGELKRQLDNAGIFFSAVNGAPPITISIRETDLEKLLNAVDDQKVRLPSVFDLK